MTFSEAVIRCLRKYADFKGRAPRAEYWWFALFCFGGSALLGFVENIINGATGTEDGPQILSAAFALATFLPSLSSGWRRMHDSGRSGLFLLYPLLVVMGITTYISIVVGPEALAAGEFATTGLPALLLIIGFLVLLISPFLVIFWLTRPSEPGPNAYGPNPYEVTQ